jgi:hypothetical protein
LTDILDGGAPSGFPAYTGIPYFPIFDPQDPDPYTVDWPLKENQFLGPESERCSKEYKVRTWKTRFIAQDKWRNAGTWQASHAYSVGDCVKDGSYVYMAVEDGVSGGSTPSWPTTEEDTVDDGSVTWICYNSSQITCLLNFIDNRQGGAQSFYVWMPLMQEWVLAVLPKDPFEITPVGGGMINAVYVEIKFEEIQ